MSDVFRMDAAQSGDRVELILGGPLDSQGSVSLKEEGRSRLRSGTRVLVIDCSSVTFISSSGVGSLLVLQDEYEDAEGLACFRSPSPEVRSVIRLMDLERILNVVSDEEEIRTLLTGQAV